MTHTVYQKPNVRICNFSNIDLQDNQVLTFDSSDIKAVVEKIRNYADLPHVYIVAQENAGLVADLLSALKAIRSPCYPYAVFSVESSGLNIGDPEPDIVRLKSTDPEIIKQAVNEYAAEKFRFDDSKLSINNQNPLPAEVDVVIVGAGITGLYAAQRLEQAGIFSCILEKRDRTGGIWSMYANPTSQVNSSEGAYRLIEKKYRSNRDHSATREILDDIAQVTEAMAGQLFLETEVVSIKKEGRRYYTRLNRGGEGYVLESKGIVLAINDRVGPPRDIKWENQSQFRGRVVSGFSGDTMDVDWKDKRVVVVGMGAFAVENTRTALENGASQVTVLARRHGTICPKIIDYLNFATPYDDAFKHDNKSNMRNMMYWKKLYDLSGATQPECWMKKIKHDGHTISVSDIWFIGHYLKKIRTIVGEISRMTETGVMVGGGEEIPADIVVNCVGFERNTSSAESLTGYVEMYNNNYLDKDFFYLADAYIDSDAFNSLFGSSVLEMVKFYTEVFVRFFDTPDYETMVNTRGIEKIPIKERKWSHYIQGAMALMRDYPEIKEAALKQVAQRTKNFMEVHDLNTYIRSNKREWIDTHVMLAGRPMTEEECLPYVFDRLL